MNDDGWFNAGSITDTWTPAQWRRLNAASPFEDVSAEGTLHAAIDAAAEGAMREIRNLAAYHRRCHAQRVRRAFEALRREHGAG